MNDQPPDPGVIPGDPLFPKTFDELNPDSGSLVDDRAREVVLILSGEADREWAARAVVALSILWSKNGRHAVLADLHVEHPLVTTGEGIEGVVDVLLYGGSPSRVMRSGPGGSFVIRAGTYTADASEIHQHPGWTRLRAEVQRDGGCLLIFAPAEAPHVERLADWVPEVVLLGSAGESEAGQRLLAEGSRVTDWFVPPEESTATPVQAELPAGIPAASRTSDGPPVSEALLTADEVSAQEGISAPAPIQGSGAPSSPFSRHLRIPGVGAVSRENLVTFGPLAGLTVLFLGMLVLILGQSTAGESFLPEFVAEAGEDSSFSGVQADFLAYSVSVTAFPTLSAALDLAAADEAKVPSTGFFVSPEEIQGVLYYRVLAGMLHDTVSANELRDQLIKAGVIVVADAGGAWNFLHSAPLTFDLGYALTGEAASARVDSLALLGIPAYTAELFSQDGSRRWRIYAGAYRDPTEAAWMRNALRAAGLESTLVSREGSPISAPE
ncbi:MAG: SPOR domain-containing protein [Gemmatimonadota bacterium]|jgi:hypothetical protein|nr:SPOR domain-containing protein [Gemmatimonadota bacterium]